MNNGLFVAVMAYGGSTKNPCVKALLTLQGLLAAQSIPYAFSLIDTCDVVDARNLGASLFLEGQHSHLLFVDEDTLFTPPVIERLFKADQPFVGCACPMRKLPIELAVGPEIAGGRTLGDLIEREHVGMALAMIRRDCLEALRPNVREYDGDRFRADGLRGAVYGFFDRILENPEDRSFCLRWREAGGIVWALHRQPIGHVGKFVYRATE